MFRHRSIVYVFAAILAAAASPLSGQEESALNPGDVVRVDHDFVGTLMSISGSSTLTVLGEGKQRCWPGIQHGEAPRCDPAPLVRRVVDWNETTIERQLVGVSYMRRMVLGGLVGAAVMAPIGRLTGPSLGYGKIPECVDVSVTRLCTNPISFEEFETRQRAQDQKRGTFVGAFFGASVGAIVARKTADEWVQLSPPALSGTQSWDLELRVPTGQH